MDSKFIGCLFLFCVLGPFLVVPVVFFGVPVLVVYSFIDSEEQREALARMYHDEDGYY